MKTLTNTIGMKRQAGKLLIFAVIMAVLITAFVPLTGSIVYGDEALSGEAVTTPKWTVKFLDIDGTTLKVETVEDHGDATPPNINAKKGYKFLGWDAWYVDVTEDRTIRAVYELVMSTTDEEDGELGAAGTAKPPEEKKVEKIAIATEGGLEVIDTSEDAITTPEIIKSNPTPTTVIEDPDTNAISPTTIVLIIVAALVVLAVAGYFLFMFLRKKRNKELNS